MISLLGRVLINCEPIATHRRYPTGEELGEFGHDAIAQVERASALIGKVDPMIAPTWVDPVIWKASVPADNLPTPARVALGKKLFFELRLSRDRTLACATCHDVTRSFADLRPVAEGIGDQLGHRNAPTVMNAALLASQFWDGRAAYLEDQALLPIVNPIEMGMPTGEAAVAAIVNGLLRAVDDVNRMAPQPDFVLYGGDLAQLGEATQLELGAQIVKTLKPPVRMIRCAARRWPPMIRGCARSKRTSSPSAPGHRSPTASTEARARQDHASSEATALRRAETDAERR